MKDVQELVSVWHRKQFPRASTNDVCLKIAEEVGEVCKAILGVNDAYTSGEFKERTMAVKDEIGDAVISLMVLAARFNWDIDELVQERADEVTQREYVRGVRI